MNDSEQIPSSVAAPEKLVAAVRRVLRPLIRLLLSHGLTYPWLSDLLKEIFVEVADKEFQLDRKRQTDSRISLLTGVHRKDVRRLRSMASNTREPTPAAVSLGAQLVGRWLSDARFHDADGNPLPLHRLASKGGELSFDSLVASVSKDIRARAVLDEWLRLGVVRLDEEERVVLHVDAFVPAQGFDEKAHYFGQNVHDHLAAAASNLIGERAPFLERSMHYDTLTPESARELAIAAEKLGMHALKTANRRAAQLADNDADANDARMRVTFGVYFYAEPMESRDEDA